MRLQNRKKNQTYNVLLLSGLVLAVSLLLYPTIMDLISYITQSSSIVSYEESVQSLSRQEIEIILADVQDYNEQLAMKQAENSFAYAGEDYEDDRYDHLLNPGYDDIDRILGYIEIPCVDIFLPIAHGTKSEQLLYEAGHVYGSSFPVPGSSTRAVIAGHTGLKEALLFTNLTKVSEGDWFYIHVLGKTFPYQVTKIEIVLPEEADSHLQIVSGENLVTLYTCTPYGVNDHRLLVTGKYVDEKTEDHNANEIAAVGISGHEKKKYIALLSLVFFIPVGIFVTGMYLIGRRNK